MHDIFISYSHADKITADAICAKLEQQGIRCWYAPRDAAFGDAWASSIVNAIKNTKAMILVFTEFSNASAQVRKEVTLAVNSAKTIIPFRATNTMPTDSMEYLLCDLHWLDAYNEDMSVSLNALLERVKAIVPGEGKAAALSAGEKTTVLQAQKETAGAKDKEERSGANTDREKLYMGAITSPDTLSEIIAEHSGKDFKRLNEREKHHIRMDATRMLAAAKGLGCVLRPEGTLGRTLDVKNIELWEYCSAIDKEFIRLLKAQGWKQGKFDLHEKTIPFISYEELSANDRDKEEIFFENIIAEAGKVGYPLYLPLNEAEMKIADAQAQKIIDEAKSRNELWRGLLPYFDLPGMEKKYEDALDIMDIKMGSGRI